MDYVNKLEQLVRGAMSDPLVHDVEEGTYCYFCGCSDTRAWDRPKSAIEIDGMDGWHTQKCWIVRALDVLNNKVGG